MSVKPNLAHNISEVRHLLGAAHSFQTAPCRPRAVVLPLGRAMLIGRPCLAIECLREAMNLRGLETDSFPFEQDMSVCASSYDVLVIFLMRCEPSALTVIKQRMAELRAKMPGLPAVALIEDAEAGHAAFTGMGFSTVILGLPSASFAVDVIHLLMRGARHLREFDPPDGEQQVLGLPPGEDREASLVPADVCFTRRETALLDLLRRGMQNKIIAYKL